MELPENSLKREWLTTGTNELWETGGTYSSVAYHRLPRPPELDVQLGWLTELPDREYSCTLNCEESNIGDLGSLAVELSEFGLSFPEEFMLFMSQPELQARVPSCTACYLETSDAVTPLPGFPGSFVVRFMNDQQCCVMWYLLFQPGAPTRVLASGYFIERDIFDAMEYLADDDEPLSFENILSDASICGESFGEFMYRFCIENCIWFATHENHQLSERENEYIIAARQSAEDVDLNT